MLRKIVAALLLVTLMIMISACGGEMKASESGSIGDDAKWEYYETDRKLVISGSGEMDDYDTWNQTPWSELGVQTVEIKEGITTIGRMSFAHMQSLVTIAIPESVTSINGYALCESMEVAGVRISEHVKYIGEWAFVGVRISDISLSDELTYLGNHAFYGAELDEIEIPSSVSVIEEGVFMHSTIKRITIPENVTEIKELAFNGCKQLTDVYYCGTEKQWLRIKIAEGNDELLGARIHCEWNN